MSKKFKIVKLPDLNILKVPSGLLDFYVALGFNKEGTTLVKPMNVLLHPDDQLDVLKAFRQGFADENGKVNPDDEIGINFMFMQSGPSSDTSIDKGTVKLVENWIVEE